MSGIRCAAPSCPPGQRRGAMMGRLRSTIPTSRRSSTPSAIPARLRNFNLSVLVTDAFMAAVEGRCRMAAAFDGEIFRTVRARALWDQFMHATYDVAEPGVIFIDRVNAQNNLALLRDHPRQQPVRRAAAAALWRLPAWLDQPGAAGRRTVRRDAALDDAEQLGELTADRGADARQCHRRSRYPLARAGGRSEGQAPHRPRHYRARRRLAVLRRGLWQRRGRRADARMAGDDQARGLSRLGRAGRRKGRVPALRRERMLEQPTSRRSTTIPAR